MLCNLNTDNHINNLLPYVSIIVRVLITVIAVLSLYRCKAHKVPKSAPFIMIVILTIHEHEDRKNWGLYC